MGVVISVSAEACRGVEPEVLKVHLNAVVLFGRAGRVAASPASLDCAVPGVSEKDLSHLLGCGVQRVGSYHGPATTTD